MLGDSETSVLRSACSHSPMFVFMHRTVVRRSCPEQCLFGFRFGILGTSHLAEGHQARKSRTTAPGHDSVSAFPVLEICKYCHLHCFGLGSEDGIDSLIAIPYLKVTPSLPPTWGHVSIPQWNAHLHLVAL
ncbi:hypothetical protein OE88DRAFT_842691 [Heliocybe sulcata]|uniref:Uncharacterized protein n=1 Tax=Heliocybe sulcata TaxID=5364 RepID=A0A5C3MQ87_9AGAM|nr:hypothetical protein OE88DRAFT_842691 [Heliocybe sulcata]